MQTSTARQPFGGRMSHYDAIIVGSGPGGAMAADVLVRSGQRVLMLERGDWVRRGPENHDARSVAMLSKHYSSATPCHADTDNGRHLAGAFHCVGGQSVFYGAVALRYREADFVPDSGTAAESGAAWPFGYDELEPHYMRAEQLLGVSGDAGADPTEPFRASPFPQASPPLSPLADQLHAAARRLGLNPFRPPLAVMRDGGLRTGCVSCGACNGFACAVGAKGDASVVVSALLDRGLELRTQVAVVRILSEGTRATGVEYIDLPSRRIVRAFGDRLILAAGALATPQLLLASGVQAQNPGRRVVGRYLTRHCNAVVCGVFRRAPGSMSYKEFAVHDFYLGDERRPQLGGLGSIQQEALPAAMVEAELPRMLRPVGRAVLPHLAALIVMTEDAPLWSNRVALDRRHVNALGMPGLRVHHRYAARDIARRHALVIESRRILAAAGAVASFWRPIDTFSHALGTVRMGTDPAMSALDGDGRFRGYANLHVVDGSALPTSAAVNPSLTIAANALRVADRITRLASRTDHDVHAERREAAYALA